MEDELKDISDAHERRKAQNRIAQRRRRQRLRQDAKSAGGDVTEMTGLDSSDLNLLGPETGELCLHGALPSAWNRDVGLDTEASLMDFSFLDPSEMTEFNEGLGASDITPQKITADPSLSKRVGQITSDHCRHCSSHTSRPSMPSPADGAFAGPFQAKATETVEGVYDRRDRHYSIQKPQAVRSSSGSQSVDAKYFPLMDDAATAAGMSTTELIRPSSQQKSSRNTISKRTWSDSRVQQQQHHHQQLRVAVAPSPQRLSSTSSYRSSSSSDSGGRVRDDDWEFQRSPIASTLSQRSQKLATDLIRLYELGVYLDIQSKDTELEELLSEVRRKLAVLHGNAEQSARITTNDPNNDWR
ncbi:uncharacterized protein Z520_00648 [Fonsecaea multimorphosa CBS 102226]|uniref:BZIP domain-containing protein n=1 Tax=Fonsecaea multimorphosa CBS 102226 TaxID=1442371 RepID=A0A0D2HQ08_9EURO|nr:uncharacterized protein Z520_00648 [Fonsecaea multimorphosa CBS 102226]KIY03956.1 hypothetical protein Z520_00648 [Fonsecaea multimorphosa CBS 102226]OAL31796.1 hypothetical protein AYO22_00666 [Fonsecaea multimorphosa]